MPQESTANYTGEKASCERPFLVKKNNALIVRHRSVVEVFSKITFLGSGDTKNSRGQFKGCTTIGKINVLNVVPLSKLPTCFVTLGRELQLISRSRHPETGQRS